MMLENAAQLYLLAGASNGGGFVVPASALCSTIKWLLVLLFAGACVWMAGTGQRTKRPSSSGSSQGRDTAVKGRSGPLPGCEGAGGLPDLKRPRGTDAVRGQAQRKARCRFVPHPQRFHQPRARHRTENAGEDHQYRRQ